MNKAAVVKTKILNSEFYYLIKGLNELYRISIGVDKDLYKELLDLSGRITDLDYEKEEIELSIRDIILLISSSYSYTEVNTNSEDVLIPFITKLSRKLSKLP